MGLLEKRNPRATRRSVIRAAAIGAVGFFLFALIMILLGDFPPWAWFFALAWMTLAGAVTGAAIEWQMPDDELEEEAPGAVPDRCDDTDFPGSPAGDEQWTK